MNPSANGWINKLFRELNDNAFNDLSFNELYINLRTCGFIYGSNIHVISQKIENKDLSNEEICKINLVLGLYYTYKKAEVDTSFIESTTQFYKSIHLSKISFFQDFFGEKKGENLLETIIHKRVLIDHNFITKTFNYFITNALLYTDILAFKHYLRTGTIAETYIKQKEGAIQTIVINVLNAKAIKTEYDSSLIQLFEQSLRYQQNTVITYKEALSLIHTELEAQYILDLACMATWSDANIDMHEQQFLYQLGSDLKLEKNEVFLSITAITDFFTAHKNEISLLGSKNIVKAFYDNSSKMVSKLISRNSKRLQKELVQSKELMVLLTQSTLRDLSDEEQKKVQDQLLDIFKTIPSLAIFLLPGGALLLPLVIKFIPKLLPSAFDDNRIEE